LRFFPTTLAEKEENNLRNNLPYFSYLVKDKERKVNSIEFFKKGIEPRWEDKKNENGGRLVFQVQKSDKSNAIYEGLVFYLMGEGFELSERLNGFRFISSKSPSSVSFRA